jgi:hypothetical protein
MINMSIEGLGRLRRIELSHRRFDLEMLIGDLTKQAMECNDRSQLTILHEKISILQEQLARIERELS